MSEDAKTFKVSRTVRFYETDLMGVVHHVNYLKYFEDARVDWMVHSGLVRHHFPHVDRNLAVLSTRVEHLAPCRFMDEIDVFLQVRMQRLKIEFQYAIQDRAQKIALGLSTHVMVDQELKPKKLSRDFVLEMEKWGWTETWL